MKIDLKLGLPANVTVVSNEFIDQYMAAANGEYVKVFLYLLRHEREELDLASIADALNHTEADVKRALAYWKRTGVLAEDDREEADGREEFAPDPQIPERNRENFEPGARTPERKREEFAPDSRTPERKQEDFEPARRILGREENRLPETGDTYERMRRLSGDEEFSALLYAVQQYLGKTFTQIECEKFAFFYDGLHMSGELLEYLAEYCAGGGHSSIRYIEKVAISWYQAGIRTREEAREYTARFSGDTAAVLKAFGITGRTAGTAEQDFIRRWFKEYGFDKSLVVEACSRTITATGSASFPYADKILKGWSEQQVRTLKDVETLDRKRQQRKAEKEQAAGADRRGGAGRETSGRKRAGANGFRNFEERTGDIDDFVWLKNRKRKEDEAGGAQ